MQRMWKRIIVILICLFFPPCINANFLSSCVANFFYNSCWSPVLVFSGGAAFNTNLGESKNFPAQDGVLNFFDYASNHTLQTHFMWGSFLGIEFLLNPTWALQAGFSYYRPTNFRIHGIVTQGTNVATQTQFNYKYGIESAQYLAEGKLMYFWRDIDFYLSAGAGEAWHYSNKFFVDMHGFAVKTSSPIFQNKTIYSFTYSIGAGMDVNLAEHIRVGIGYRFADFGGSKIGNAFIQNIETNYTLSQSHLYTNELLAQVTLILL